MMRKLRLVGIGDRIENLEKRDLKTAATVSLNGGVIDIAAASQGSQAIVQYQMQGRQLMVDVQVDGVDHLFSPTSLVDVEFDAGGAGSTNYFENDTTITGFAFAGGGTNTFVSGAGINEFFTASAGSTTVDATQGNTLVFESRGAATILDDGGWSLVVGSPPA